MCGGRARGVILLLGEYHTSLTDLPKMKGLISQNGQVSVRLRAVRLFFVFYAGDRTTLTTDNY